MSLPMDDPIFFDETALSDDEIRDLMNDSMELFRKQVAQIDDQFTMLTHVTDPFSYQKTANFVDETNNLAGVIAEYAIEHGQEKLLSKTINVIPRHFSGERLRQQVLDLRNFFESDLPPSVLIAGFACVHERFVGKQTFPTRMTTQRGRFFAELTEVLRATEAEIDLVNIADAPLEVFTEFLWYHVVSAFSKEGTIDA